MILVFLGFKSRRLEDWMNVVFPGNSKIKYEYTN